MMECPYCHKEFESKKGLSIHIGKLHIIEDRYSCPVCFRRFYSPHGLRIHLAKKHGTELEHR